MLVSTRKSYEAKLTELALIVEHLMERDGVDRDDILERTEIEPEVLDTVLDADIHGADVRISDLAKLEVFFDEDIVEAPYKQGSPRRHRNS